MNRDIQNMIKENFELSKKLSPENDRVFTDIVCYLRTSDIDEMQAEETIQHILDMFLSAQQRGEALKHVIGSDYKEFCDNIVTNSPKQRFSVKLLTFIELLLFCMVFMWVIDLAFEMLPELVKNKQFDPEYNVTLGLLARIIAVLAIAYTLVNYIGKNSFKLSNQSNKSWFICGTLFGLFLLLPAFLSYQLKNYVLFTTGLHYIAIVLLPSYLIVRYYNRWK